MNLWHRIVCAVVGHRWGIVPVPYPNHWLGWVEKCQRCGGVK